MRKLTLEKTNLNLVKKKLIVAGDLLTRTYLLWLKILFCHIISLEKTPICNEIK